MRSFNPYLQGLAKMNVGDLVRFIAEVPEVVETEELEWKRTWDFSSRPKRAELARHLIGLANRDPDRAARIFGGHAFLLIGIEPGRFGNAPELDPADIVQALTPYTGTALRWHPVYVAYQGHRVLVLVVDPPRWGDPEFSLQKSSADPVTGREIRAGSVYVRRPGTTVPAEPADRDALRLRASVPVPRLSVSLNWNLGARGSYIGVSVYNGPMGRSAKLKDVGFTQADTATLSEPFDDPDLGRTDYALAYLSFPMSLEEVDLAPGETKLFHAPLGRLPWCWDRETDVFPYAYYDEGHWLVGEPVRILNVLTVNGWRENPQHQPIVDDMYADYVWPPVVSGLRARFDMVTLEPTDGK